MAVDTSLLPAARVSQLPLAKTTACCGSDGRRRCWLLAFSPRWPTAGSQPLPAAVPVQVMVPSVVPVVSVMI